MDNWTELIEKARKHDKEAFASLYESVYRDLYKFVYYTLGHKEDAEDVVGETVADAFESIGRLRDAQAFRGWLFKIASNKCRHRLKSYVSKTVPIEENTRIFEWDYEGTCDLHHVFKELSDMDRMIVSLAVFGGYTSAEIGTMLHVRAGTVRSRQSRALQSMRIKLEG